MAGVDTGWIAPLACVFFFFFGGIEKGCFGIAFGLLVHEEKQWQRMEGTLL